MTTAPRRAAGPVHPDPHEQLLTELWTLLWLWQAAANRRNGLSLVVRAEQALLVACVAQLQDVIRRNPA